MLMRDIELSTVLRLTSLVRSDGVYGPAYGGVGSSHQRLLRGTGFLFRLWPCE